MKKHAIIPIFIPHEGCPHDCIFCNQNKITARAKPVTTEDAENIIIDYLKTLENRNLETIEVAFFGGSFTAIELERQREYLALARKYKHLGKIHKIHLSTRPDAINEEILDNLKAYEVDVIELGVQSLVEDVLKASNRGHNSRCVYESAGLIKAYGFQLGIQLMIGLPLDTPEKSIFSAKETVKIKPEIARLYPTVIIEDTGLMDLYKRGDYKPMSQEASVKTTKEMYKILSKAGINIIRVGLKSTDIINSNLEITGNTFHPAFRQIVESEIAKEIMEEKMLKISQSNEGEYFQEGLTNENLNKREERVKLKKKVTFCSNSKSFSNMIGHHKSNKIYFNEKYKNFNIKFSVDNKLNDYEYEVLIKGDTK